MGLLLEDLIHTTASNRDSDLVLLNRSMAVLGTVQISLLVVKHHNHEKYLLLKNKKVDDRLLSVKGLLVAKK